MDTRVAGGFRIAIDSAQKIFFGYEDFIDAEVVNSIPYASMKLKIGKGPYGLLVLESIESNKTIWASADDVHIDMQGGKIIRTSGLNNNLIHYSYPGNLLEAVSQEKTILKYFSYYSYDKPRADLIRTEVEVKNLGTTMISSLGTTHEVVLLEEKVISAYLGWKVNNRYWVDPNDGFIWRSEQNISPKLPTFYIEITKKPAL